MPEYLYSDGEHRRTVIHSMADDPPITCEECGASMHRVPQPVAIVWGGNPPSVGTHPLVEQLNKTRDERRDAFAAKKEAHVNRTSKS